MTGMEKEPPMTASPQSLKDALPFWLSLGTVPLALLGATLGGWCVILLPLYAWMLTRLLDAIAGLNAANADPETPERTPFWYRLITLIWFPIEALTIYGVIWWMAHGAEFSALEMIVLFFGIGVMSGTIGIVYSHELLHQKTGIERWLGDLLLAVVLYTHFRSEHLLVHHRYVGTPRDAVTARYNEGFHRYFWRILRHCPGSAWRAEKQMLAHAGKSPLSLRNPFWRYGLLQLAASLPSSWRLAAGWGLRFSSGRPSSRSGSWS